MCFANLDQFCCTSPIPFISKRKQNPTKYAGCGHNFNSYSDTFLLLFFLLTVAKILFAFNHY